MQNTNCLKNLHEKDPKHSFENRELEEGVLPVLEVPKRLQFHAIKLPENIICDSQIYHTQKDFYTYIVKRGKIEMCKVRKIVGMTELFDNRIKPLLSSLLH